MKPGYYYRPPSGQVRAAKPEPVLLGVGATLLVVALLVLGILLLGVIPGLYGQLFQVLGSGIEQYHTLSFLGEVHGPLFLGILVPAVIFALLLSRTRRPGLGLVIEGIVLLSLCMLLVMAVWSDTRAAGAGIWESLRAGSMKPLKPL